MAVTQVGYGIFLLCFFVSEFSHGLRTRRSFRRSKSKAREWTLSGETRNKSPPRFYSSWHPSLPRISRYLPRWVMPKPTKPGIGGFVSMPLGTFAEFSSTNPASLPQTIRAPPRRNHHVQILIIFYLTDRHDGHRPNAHPPRW